MTHYADMIKLANDCGAEVYGPKTWNITFTEDAFKNFAAMVHIQSSFIAGPIGPGEVTGPVYVNHIPYVPASEVERLRAALQFYADPANWIDAEWDDGSTDGCSTPNVIPAVNQDGAWVCDCGDIARAALGQEPTT